MEARLRHSTEAAAMLDVELFSVLERTSDAAFAVTEQGEICSWNRSAERLFGYSSVEALHRSCDELLDGRGALGTKHYTGGRGGHLCTCRQVEIPDFDLLVRTRSGTSLWVNVSTIIYEEPRRDRWLILHLARDISHRKKREELVEKVLEISHELVTYSGDVNGQPPVLPLSEQERRILRLFAKAKNSAEIARELGITLPTLRNHLHSINEKLRTHNRLEAVLQAMHRGLI